MGSGRRALMKPSRRDDVQTQNPLEGGAPLYDAELATAPTECFLWCRRPLEPTAGLVSKKYKALSSHSG